MGDATVDAIARGLERWHTLLGRQFGPLSRPQRRVMTAIAAGNDIRVGDIGERVGTTMAGATRMIDTLEELGYVRRFRRPEADGRQVYVTLTSEGAAALAEADRQYVEAVGRTVSKLSSEERTLLAQLLQAIRLYGNDS